MKRAALLPVYLCLAALCALFIFPFYWVVVSSLETIPGLNLKPPALYPAEMTTLSATLPIKNNLYRLGPDYYIKLPISSSALGGSSTVPPALFLKLEREKPQDPLKPTQMVQTPEEMKALGQALIPARVDQSVVAYPQLPVERVNGNLAGIVADRIRGSGTSYQELLLTVPIPAKGALEVISNIQVVANPSHQRVLRFHAEWSNYAKTLKGPEATIGSDSAGFLLFMRNSLFLAFFAVFAQIASSSLVAYGFARLKFKGREFLFIVLLATLMIPGQVTLIPLFFLFKSIHWVNSFLPLMVPQLTAGAFNVFLIRQFLLGLPKELDESAKMDGATHWQIYRRVIFPNLGPVLIVVGLFTFIASWQDVMGPLIYLDNPALRTVTLGLEYFRSPYVDNRPLLLTGAVFSIIPVFLLFLVAQKHILAGIATTGLKD